MKTSTRLLLAGAITIVAAVPATAQSKYFARQNLTAAKAAATTTPPATPPPTPTSCGTMTQNYLPPSNAKYVRAAVGSTLAARLADAKTACQNAQATVCAYNDSAPAQGGGYTIYISTTKGDVVRYSQGDVYWAANCA